MPSPIVVKWKFKKVAKSQHDMVKYLEYIEKQMKNRRENSGAYENTNPAIGIKENIDQPELVLSEMDNVDDKMTYLKYIAERKGSKNLFSESGIDVTLLTDELKEKDGTVWIPIVSLKEKDALLYEIDTEAKWVEKARELAEAYRDELDIAKDNFRYVAAFHSKADIDQNHKKDAGCQPHIHFIIWEEHPTRANDKISRNELKSIQKATENILAGDYKKTLYVERNELRDEIKEKSMDKLDIVQRDVASIMIDVNIMTKSKGRLTSNEITRRTEMSMNIYEKMKYNKELTEAETKFKIKNSISTASDAKKLSANYWSLEMRLDNVVDRLVETEEIKEVVDSWKKVTDDMREMQGQQASKDQTAKDLEKIKESIKNAILDEAKKSYVASNKVSVYKKGQIIEKLNVGSFANKNDSSSIENSLRVLSNIGRVAGIDKEELIEKQFELLTRSDCDHFKAMALDIVDDEFKKLSASIDYTSNDVADALLALKLPRKRVQPFELLDDAKNVALTKSILKSLNEQSILYRYAPASRSILDIDPDRLIGHTMSKTEMLTHFKNITEELEKQHQEMSMKSIDEVLKGSIIER